MPHTLHRCGACFICDSVELLTLQVQHETNALREFGVDIEVTIHLDGHLLTDRQTKTIACGEVFHLKERLEDIFTLLFRDAAAGVGHQELKLVSATLFEGQDDVATYWRVLRGIAKQVKQDV